MDEVRNSVRWLIESGVDFIKSMSTGGFMTPGSNTLRAQYTVEELSTMAREAHCLDRHVVAHASGIEGIRNSIEAGIDGIAHCHWRNMRGAEYDPRLVDRMVRQGTFLVKDLHVNGARGLGSTELEHWVNSMRGHLVDHRRMIEAGVQLVLCTDAGLPGGPLDTLHWVVALAPALLDITVLEAITASTRTPALEMGILNQVGTLEVGKQADLVLVKGNPLKDPFRLAQVDRVFKAGVEVVSGGKLRL